MCIKKTPVFRLDEIAAWQLENKNSKVELPALQRNFVWKVNQIEALWDSLLRGFPIGSFLLSKDEKNKLFLLDGQQRATSIAIGYYNPWQIDDTLDNGFWSLKDVPVVWIDLCPTSKATTYKFVTRVVTRSHPWGYKRIENNAILSVSDRKCALEIFQTNPCNKELKYIQLPTKNIFPYDANLPVPLSFLTISKADTYEEWKKCLLELCQKYLPVKYIKTYYNKGEYLSHLSELLYSDTFDTSIFQAIRNLKEIEIPGIIVEKEIIKSEDLDDGEDPTLFVRLNSSGTRLAGEELIYSIYKASFPEAKELVENIGQKFLAPSLVISLSTRLVQSGIQNNAYPYPFTVNDFIKKIQDKDDHFKAELKKFIGSENDSPAKRIFSKAIEILRSESIFQMPPVLVKNIINTAPDLFLMLLQWLCTNKSESSLDNRKILGAVTALAWFSPDNKKFVRNAWNSIGLQNFWSKKSLCSAWEDKTDSTMHPLVKPVILRDYLKKAVAEDDTSWNDLYPDMEHAIFNQYQKIISDAKSSEQTVFDLKLMWDNFINRLFSNKGLVLFAQRKYVNREFDSFNAMETLEDTNTPWDWDHIYPSSWVYNRRNIKPNTRRWSNSIGNLRALSLETNRSENNSLSPKERLEDFKPESFIRDNDWVYWSKMNDKIDNDEEIKNHLLAIIHRFCNIYEDWYLTLCINDLFSVEDEPA